MKSHKLGLPYQTFIGVSSLTFNQLLVQVEDSPAAPGKIVGRKIKSILLLLFFFSCMDHLVQVRGIQLSWQSSALAIGSLRLRVGCLIVQVVMIVSFTRTGGLLFLSNGEQDRNMPLKNSTETKKDGLSRTQRRQSGQLVRSNIDRTWAIVGVGGSPRVTSSGIPGEEDQVGPCEQLDVLSPFNPLSKMW